MINTVYRLVAPRRFEIAFEDIDLFGDNAIVRPTNSFHLQRRYALLSGHPGRQGAGREAAYGADP